MANTILPQILNAGIYDASAVYKHRTETPDRRVSVFEIELPSTKGGINFINDTPYPISPNHIICGKPEQIRHTKLPFRCSFIHLILEDKIIRKTVASFPDYIDVSANVEKYAKLFSEIIRAFTFPLENGELYLGGKVLQLLYLLSCESVIKNSSEIAGKDIITRSIAYMDEHFTENITLADMASAMKISPVYFQKMFSHAMGQTPYNYILNKKLDMAKKLLVSSTYSLAEIAFQCGFSSQSYFGQVFKKKTSMTPFEYRKKKYTSYTSI